jgi:hypothetical protein
VAFSEIEAVLGIVSGSLHYAGRRSENRARGKKPARSGRDDRWSLRDLNWKFMVYHVYILASASGVLYTGVTRYLERRAGEHQRDVVDGFTKRYEFIG